MSKLMFLSKYSMKFSSQSHQTPDKNAEIPGSWILNNSQSEMLKSLSAQIENEQLHCVWGGYQDKASALYKQY